MNCLSTATLLSHFRQKVIVLIKKRIEDKYNEIKNIFYINETGGYGDNYKKELIKNFNLDSSYALMVMKMSYGDILGIVKDLETPKT